MPCDEAPVIWLRPVRGDIYLIKFDEICYVLELFVIVPVTPIAVRPDHRLIVICVPGTVAV